MFRLEVAKLELQMAYREMAHDAHREREAVTWCESLLNDGNMGTAGEKR